MAYVATEGAYWSSSPYSSFAYRSYSLYFSYNGYVSTSDNSYRSIGFSLRCVQE